MHTVLCPDSHLYDLVTSALLSLTYSVSLSDLDLPASRSLFLPLLHPFPVSLSFAVYVPVRLVVCVRDPALSCGQYSDKSSRLLFSFLCFVSEFPFRHFLFSFSLLLFLFSVYLPCLCLKFTCTCFLLLFCLSVFILVYSFFVLVLTFFFFLSIYSHQFIILLFSFFLYYFSYLSLSLFPFHILSFLLLLLFFPRLPVSVMSSLHHPVKNHILILSFISFFIFFFI